MIGSRSLLSIVLPGVLPGLLLAVLAGLVLEGGRVSVAYADPPANSSVADAGTHFQRGVSLYNEADYRAALVEFHRAYEIAPNTAVLYNIGQTYYQLQNYAAALSTFTRYLTEAGAAAAHRQEVEQAIETLKARVGKVEVTTNVPDCEITIDDEPAGKTPLREPVLVSIGRRKVTATRAGLPPETRFVEVAVGDTVKLSFALGEPAAPAASPASEMPAPAISPLKPTGTAAKGDGLITAGWITAGVLGAGAVGSGVLAYLASRDLNDARNTYPVSHDDLAKKSSRLSTLAKAGDLLGLAAVVAGGVTLTVTLSRSSSHEMHLAVAPNGIRLAGTFR